MNRFFWVTLARRGDVTIAEKVEGTEFFMVPGSDMWLERSDLIIGSEIKYERTGFLAALNDVK